MSVLVSVENEEEYILITIFIPNVSLESTPQKSLSLHEDDASLLMPCIDFDSLVSIEIGSVLALFDAVILRSSGGGLKMEDGQAVVDG